MDRLAAHALDLFALLGVPVVARRMFGGLGFYADGLFFAIGDPDEGLLFLKVDEETRGAFEEAGGRAFTYAMPGKEVVSMAYLTPPDGALDDPEEMRPWALLALAAARRAAAAKAARAAAKGQPRARTGGAARKPAPARTSKRGPARPPKGRGRRSGR